MKIDTLFGVPAHPLLVHIPVVFTPLAALGLLVIVVRPGWRRTYGWLVVAAAALAAIGAQLAESSGERLQHRIDVNAAVRRHVDLARTARPLVFVFFVLALAYVALPWWLDRRSRAAVVARGVDGPPVPRPAPAWARPTVAALAAASLVFAGLATTWIIRAGHEGAKATWQGTGENRQGGDNDGGAAGSGRGGG
jgi:hypothetical protein